MKNIAPSKCNPFDLYKELVKLMKKVDRLEKQVRKLEETEYRRRDDLR